MMMPTLADRRPELQRAYRQAAAVLDAVTAADLAKPTPCDHFDVAALADHLVFAAWRAAALGQGRPVSSDDEVPHLDADWGDSVRLAAADAAVGWDDGLGREISLPWGTYPAPAVVDIYLSELVAHAWDLAVATGHLDLLDDDLAEAALVAAPPVIPAAFRGGEIPFGPVVDVEPDAGVYDRFAGFMGRTPPGS
jgi:uncharacterized protein (TIGR03086 family)